MALENLSIDLEKFLSEASKEELINYIYSKLNIESIPVSIFSCELSPLEAITRYLKDVRKKSINEIARILSKHSSAISIAYKNSQAKNIIFEKNNSLQIPLYIYSENKELSISEATVMFLINRGMKIASISSVLNKDNRTVWTFVDRAKKKLKLINKNFNSLEIEKFLKIAQKNELIEYINSLEKEINKNIQNEEEILENKESIPVSIFSCELSPLEAITRYLKEEKKKSINEIARILSKHSSAISIAYKNSQAKNFDYNKSDIEISLIIFSENKELSISEATVMFLINRGMKIATISSVLNKDGRTVWTFVDRAKKKLKGGEQNEKE